VCPMCRMCGKKTCKIDPLGRQLHIGVIVCKRLILKMVGERGFEPPTPWSRTSFNRLLKSIEILSFQLLWIERLAGSMRRAVVFCGFWRLWQLQIRLQSGFPQPEFFRRASQFSRAVLNASVREA
jgi:hypothetical protein